MYFKRLVFSVTFLLCCLFQAGAQNVTLSAKNLPLSSVFREIESQTGLSIIFDASELDATAKVSASFNATPVLQAVRQIVGKDMECRLKDKMIVIYSAEKTAAQAPKSTFPVKGRVIDENGDPLIGAGVLPRDGAGNGTVTDIDGRFNLSLGSGESIIEVSFLGYVSQSILVGGRSEISVQLEPDKDNVLSEVVLIGYGSSQRQDLTGSVAAVKMADLRASATLSVDQALQGRIAGVDIMSSSGEPGAPTTIRVRGTRSITASNEPLIVVDGVIDAVEDFNDINPEDIEQISILKDASSTAIYGARGANGVILVTTRQGETPRPSIGVKAEFGVSKIARTLDVMNSEEFLRYLNDRYYFIGTPTAPKFDPADFSSDTNWLDEITRVATYANATVSISSKVNKLKYYATLGYNNTQGIIRGSGEQRITGRLNLSYDFTKWFSLSFKGAYTRIHKDNNLAKIGGKASADMYSAAIYLSPIMSPMDYNNPLYENGQRINTPCATIGMNTDKTQRMTHNNVLEFTFTPVKGLKIKSQNAYMEYQRHDYRFYPSTLPAKVDGEGAAAYRYEGDAARLSTENTVNYNRKFGRKHHLDALLGYSYFHELTNTFSLNATGLISDHILWNDLKGIASKENYTANTGSTLVKRQSFYARADYNYGSRYYITLTGRMDGSSSFAANHKWGFFPSGAIKWNLKNEKFLKKVQQIDQLSLRISAGRSGNDAIKPYRSLSAYGSTTSGYLFDGYQTVTYYPSRVANPDLTWEKTDMLNAGLDFTAFSNRLSITLEAYLSRTTDLLLTKEVGSVTGFSSYYSNFGLTTNKGIEITLSSRNIVRPKFTWTSDFTLSANRQMVENIGHNEFVSCLDSGGNNPYMMYGYKAGYPLNSLWGFKYAGVWHSEDEYNEGMASRTYVSSTVSTSASSMLGVPKYEDINHDGLLTEEDLCHIGNSDPDLYGGFQNTFTYGPFRLGIYLNWSIGGEIYNFSELGMAGGYATNQYRYMLGAWHPVRNPESDLPRAGSSLRLVPSTLQMHDASYLRLKTVNFSYTLTPKSNKVLRSVTFTISGDNLLLLTRYNGFDPDVNTESDGSTLRRVDTGAYPKARMGLLGVSFKF